MIEFLPLGIGIVTAAVAVRYGGGWFRRAAWRIGMIDRPKLRGVHADTVARSGGMAIAAALLLSLLAQMISARALGLQDAYLSELSHVYLLLPLLGLFGIGALDDIRSLGAPAKLVVQALAALWAWVLGFSIESVDLFGVYFIDTGVLSPLVTVIFIVAVTNAINMIDGIDGLCSSVSAMALAGIGVFGIAGGDVQLALALPAAAAAAAFIRQNFRRPRAFLGDSGSMLFGFLIGALSLSALKGSSGAIQVAPLFVLLSLPIIDITTVFFRRILQGHSPLRADRGHIHHITLLIHGGSAKRATATLALMALVACVAAFMAAAYSELAPVAVALPIGLYGVIYVMGGYLSWRNLRAAGPATDIADLIAEQATTDGAGEALSAPGMIRLMELTRVTGLAVYDADNRPAWSLGGPRENDSVLELPLYSSGRVSVGRLEISGAEWPRWRLAFAAHLLLPLYPAFMEMLVREAVRRDTTRIAMHQKQP
ncbi:MAG: undecaprenyl/decaprenyl-phosphate alpha-N-acetylglucosaminyl 1-phosphate transferase [Nitrospira sp.]|nr:undecaprenyl/decaprenyl-phosphate alpha-N-acetylglucosaminyl 1-phosphate transferase [Nitrospira sp.]